MKMSQDFGVQIPPLGQELLREISNRNCKVNEIPGLKQFLDAPTANVDLTYEPEEIQDAAGAWFRALVMVELLDAIQLTRAASLFEVAINKVLPKRNGKSPTPNIADYVYELQVALFLSNVLSHLPNSVLYEDGTNLPDIQIELQLEFENEASRIHVECKNISKSYSDPRDLARRVADTISSAVNQFIARKLPHDRLLIFVDLPVEVDSNPYRYKEFHYYLWKTLHKSTIWEPTRDGRSQFSEANIVFTACSQQGIRDAWSSAKSVSAFSPFLPVILKHDANGRLRMDIHANALIIYVQSHIFPVEGGNPNQLNWSKNCLILDESEIEAFKSK